MINRLLLTLTLTALTTPLSSWGGSPSARPLPISAHNCYPANARGTERITEALTLGIDNIEIDLGWDAQAGKLIVGHDAFPQAGVVYPDLQTYLVEPLQEHWKTSRADRAPTVLTIDWKTEEPRAVRTFHAFLEAHPDWFSYATKSLESPLNVRRLTVCFTGRDKAKAQYDALIPAGGTYRAFRDRVFGGGEHRDDVKDYASQPADAYHRFLTFHWGNVEKGGPFLAGDWTEADAQRLKAIVTHTHEQGYRVRFYCLNGTYAPFALSYRFRTPGQAHLRWKAARDAGVDWIASDDYKEIVQVLKAK